MEREDERMPTPQVQQAMKVITFDGKLIGYVTSVGERDFRVHKLIGPDIHLAYSFVDSISEDRVHLNLSEHEIALTRWPHEKNGPLAAVPHPHREK